MTRSATENKGIWNWIDRIQGDKVIWMILILLILYSTVTIFSSTSQLATLETSRLDIFLEQIITVGIGMAIVFFCYFCLRIGWIRVLSQLGFFVSAVLLMMLLFRIGTVELNNAVRIIMIGKLQLNVYEFVKIFMIVYLAWAIHAYKSGSFWIADQLAARSRHLAFLARAGWKRIAMFIGTIMIATILIGGVPVKDIAILVAAGIIAIGGSYMLYKVSGEKIMAGRWTTVESRIGRLFNPQPADELVEGTKEWREHIDDIRQPEGAKIAIKEGGMFGKGPGKSTQKYSVALIFSDYMFSFIIEEYGLIFGAIPLIVLYISLLARGSLIVRYCDNEYAKTVIAGLTLVIAAQAMMHMFINVGLGPLTGQTLPMISHGNSSFIAFSIAFGILLSISKMAKKKIDQATREAESLIAESCPAETSASEDGTEPAESGQQTV